LITLNIEGENKSDQLIKIIDDFINKHPINNNYRILVKISDCPYRYSLDTPLYIEKISNEKFLVHHAGGTYASSFVTYDPKSDVWIDTTKLKTLTKTEYLYQYQKAIMYLETLILYIKIKLLFLENNMEKDVIFHMIYLYCQRSKITDIKIM
jgi:hypothetical protein